MKPDNYNSDIHENDYLKIYQDKIIDNKSLISIEGKEKQCLNGEWLYQIDSYDSSLRAKWPMLYKKDETLPFDFTPTIGERIKVPAVWNTEKKELRYYEGSLIYIKSFDITQSMIDKDRYYLYFEGAGYRTTLFLNGLYIGMHYGLSTPFSVEVSKEIKTKDNLLIAIVNAERTHDNIPEKNFDWVNYGGIYRDVFLVATDKIAIKDVFIYYKDGKAEINGTFTGTYSGELRLSSALFNDSLHVKGKSFSYTKECSPILWSVDNPKLYDIKIEDKNTVLWKDKIGFRTIECNGNDILLNGRKLKVKGISLHEESNKHGKAVTKNEIRKALEDAKMIGCNLVRLTHYPHSKEAARIADKLGILLWEEIPVYWAIDFNSKKAYQDAKNQLKELILRDRNRASVIIWSVGNENADSDSRLSFMSKLAICAKTLDKTRLISAACLINNTYECVKDRLSDYLDVVAINEYCGYYDHDMDKLRRILENTQMDKPLLISEFGAGAKAGYHGDNETPFTEERQADFYTKQFEIIKKFPNLSGTIVWILYDFKSPRRMNKEQMGYNSKGLISSDRTKRKIAYRIIEAFYKEDR